MLFSSLSTSGCSTNACHLPKCGCLPAATGVVAPGRAKPSARPAAPSPKTSLDCRDDPLQRQPGHPVFCPEQMQGQKVAYGHLDAVLGAIFPRQASPCRGQLLFPTGFVRKRLPRSEVRLANGERQSPTLPQAAAGGEAQLRASASHPSSPSFPPGLESRQHRPSRGTAWHGHSQRREGTEPLGVTH